MTNDMPPHPALKKTTGMLSMVLRVGVHLDMPTEDARVAADAVKASLKDDVNSSPAAAHSGAQCTTVEYALPPQDHVEGVGMLANFIVDLDEWNAQRDTRQSGQDVMRHLGSIMKATSPPPGCSIDFVQFRLAIAS